MSAGPSRKATAESFLRLVVAGKITEAYQTHTAEGFRHHNPYFPAGAPALREAMEENHALHAHKVLEVQHVLGDGELVAVHSRIRPHTGALGMAAFHLFRFEADRIVELWDVGMPVPESSPNEDGMF